MIAKFKPLRPAQRLLLFDVGNTTTTLGLWDHDDLRAVTCIPHQRSAQTCTTVAEYWAALPGPAHVAGCSVAPGPLGILRDAVLEATDHEPLIVGDTLDLPLEVRISEPRSVGTDRLCSAAAAFVIEGRACTIVDLGTAITIDCVDNEGCFIGGAILPGMNMQASALAEHTALLPEVEVTRPEGALGQSTEHAIRAGIYHGTIGAIRGIVEAYASTLGEWPVLFITGGDAPLIAGDLEIADKHVPHLCLRGVVHAYQQTFRGTEL